MVRRLVHAIATAGVTQVVLMAIQAATVPIYLHFWGARLFAEWLVLSAIPGYLTFADFGFSMVVANEMAVRAGAGDRAGALEAFQSALVAVTAILGSVLGLSLLVIYAAPLREWLNLSVLSPALVHATLTALCLQVLVNIEGAVLLAGYKCDGNYARGIVAVCAIRLAEFVAGVSALAAGCGPFGAAVSVLAARLLGIVVARLDLKRRCPWIVTGWKRATWGGVRELLGPAMAANGLPIGQVLSYQGMPIAISSALGPMQAATFSTLRNLSRLPVQLVTAAASGSSAEFCAVVGQGDGETARRLLRRLTQLVLWGTVAVLALLAVFGAPIYRIWTMHRYPFDARLYAVLLAVIIPSTIWIHMSNTAVILRRHHGMTACYVACTLLCLGCVVALGRELGATACAVALLAFDGLAAGVALVVTVRSLNDDVWEFLRFVGVPPVGWLMARARAGLGRAAGRSAS